MLYGGRTKNKDRRKQTGNSLRRMSLVVSVYVSEQVGRGECTIVLFMVM